MILDQSKMKLLLDALILTRDDEIDCDDCFDSMAEFAESRLSDKSVPDILATIDAHIRICADCAEEFEILKDTIAQMDGEFRQRGH